jgi:alpha-beta hydrolase superfamily lysophospholipase
VLLTWLLAESTLISAATGSAQPISTPWLDSSLGRRIVTTAYFKGSDGQPIRYRKYEHRGQDKAIVVFLNGRAEFIEKYDVLFSTLHEFPLGRVPMDETLTDLPITFVTLDHEGQGKSRQQKGRLGGHIDDFNSYVKDVELLFKQLPELRKHSRPIFMLSHSMGGLIAARFVQKNPSLVDGLIFSSPMFGFVAPAGLTPELLEQIAGFYAAPEPNGLNMPKLCSNPDNIDGQTLAAIAVVHSDPTLKSCFDNPSGAICGVLTQCLLKGLPNDCGITDKIDFAGLNGALQYLRSRPEGCPKRRYKWDPELTDDEAYGTWAQGHRLHGRESTFGWLFQSFQAQRAFAADNKINTPTLILVDPHDKVIDAKKAVQEFNTDESDAICNSIFDPITCEVRLFEDKSQTHELFIRVGRSAPIAAVRSFLEEQMSRYYGHH